jgi:hypothetical protein
MEILARICTACALLLVSATTYATNISMSGHIAYRNWNSTSVVLSVDEVRNNETGGSSGTLFIELWACDGPTIPANCYDVASYRLGELEGGFRYTNISSGTISAKNPPNGTYHIMVAVVEYPELNTARDYLTLGTVRFGSGGNPGTPPAARDDFGNTIRTAQALRRGGSVRGMIHSGSDVDFFSISLPRAGRLTLRTTGSTDTVGTLYDSRGRMLLKVDDACGDGTSNFCMSRRLAKGKYFIKVDGVGSAVTGSYILRSTFR